jgi:hypothetical protein
MYVYVDMYVDMYRGCLYCNRPRCRGRIFVFYGAYRALRAACVSALCVRALCVSVSAENCVRQCVVRQCVVRQCVVLCLYSL